MKNLKKSLCRTVLMVFLVCTAGLAFCQRYFSYTPDGKAVYELSTEKILLRFQSDFPDESRTLLFRQHTLLKPYRVGFVLDTPQVYFAEVQPEASIDQVEQLVEKLRSTPGIALANPFLLYRGRTEVSFTESFHLGLKNSADLPLLRRYAEKFHLQIITVDKYNPTIYFLKTTEQTPLNTLDLTNHLSETGDFAFVEPDFLMLNLSKTNDPLFELQWTLRNDGQLEESIPGEDIDIEKAWSISRGSRDINIAIIDDGVQEDHPDLNANFLHGVDITGHKPESYGYPYPEDAHGTACAGIVAATTNNGIGIAGIAHECTITNVRIFYTDQSGNVIFQSSWAASGINSAWSDGQADILSNSYGGFISSTLINTSINNAVQKGRNGKGAPVLFAAGNDDENYVEYPASNPNCIAVGASSFCGSRKSPDSCDGEDWWGSSFGDELDVVAPGVKVVSTDLTGTNGASESDYRYFNGTSAACPTAAGVMALILSVNPDLTASEARYILEASCDKVGNYFYVGDNNHPAGAWHPEMGYGRVNAYRAVQMAADEQSVEAELTLWDPLEVFPDPIVCGEEFSVFFNVINTGSVAFSGTITPVLLNEDLEIISVIDEFHEEELMPDYTYSNGLEFSNPDLLLDEGNYYVSVLYKPTGVEEKLVVKPGDYESLLPISVVCSATEAEIVLASSIQYDPSPAVAGEILNVTYKVKNTGNQTWTGAISADWVSTDREFLETVEELYNVSICAGCEKTFTFSGKVELDPGKYGLAAYFYDPVEEFWPFLEGNYDNPVPIEIIAMPQLTVNKSSINFAENGGGENFNIGANIPWSISDNKGWIRVSPDSGIGDRNVKVECDPNPTTQSRMGTITITGGGITRTINVSQSGAELELTVDKNNLSYGADGGDQIVAVNSNTTWSVSDDQSWIQVSPTSGSNDLTIGITCDPNANPQSRSGKVTVTGGGITRTINVSQSGAELELTVDKNSLSYSAGGGDQIVAVNSNTTWSVSDDQSWIRVSPTSGSNDLTIGITCDPNANPQSRSGKVTVTGGGITRTINVTQLAQSITAPWTITETGENHTIIVRSDFEATIEGIPIVPGDLVGFFYNRNGELLCSNYFIWTGNATSVAVYGDESETSLKEGFDQGERFQVKVYRAATDEVFDADAEFAPKGTDGIVTHTNTYSNDGLSMLMAAAARTATTLNIDLAAGWNMISSYVIPQDRDMLQVLSPIADQTDLIKNGKGESALPSLGINSIGEWQSTEGYKIKVDQSISLPIEGKAIDVAGTSVPLKAGWQIIAYLNDSPAPIEAQLGSIVDIIDIVKDNKGNTYLPEYGINNVGNLIPGQGYQIRVNKPGVLVYNNPATPKHGPGIAYSSLAPTAHFVLDDQLNTGNNATVIIPGEVLAQYLEHNDEIGVFTPAGILCGAGVVTDANMAITVWGDDLSTDDVEGLSVGEAYSFRSWHAAANEEREITASFGSGDGQYREDDIEVIATLDILNTLFSLDRKVFPLRVYPNPTSNQLWISLPERAESIKIFDTFGRLLKQELVMGGKKAHFLDVSDLPAALYHLQVKAGDSVWLAKVIIE